MHLSGRDLRSQPLFERRALLKGLLGSDEESRIQFSEEFGGMGMPCSTPALSMDLKASFPNTHWHPIIYPLAAARPG